ncbi:TPA: glycosyltransferase family 2 protein [Clostridium perfringens]|nr:glycosyltransferase family 2 protein [Clostridium perfringens]EJT6484006.1 glycosyltransferase family 2 protein [Clostridium perfringens]ELC8434674.1 glycosyltransferase family 2 protein [Clostridium perfringens]MDU4221909.1 glycosyltransferase family 2 protein [Clostridium perfringens]BDA23156.1 hypothetical protein CPBEC1_23660 [Clostridium perfringens]
MSYLVSIIIPMYNAEKYIERCLDSVLVQTYNNIEVIIIDDGSIDSSLKKVQCISDKRLKLYCKTNGGVSSARNFGIEKARGEFLLFVDADDYIDSKMVEELINEVNEENTLIFCNNDEIWKNRVDKRNLFSDVKRRLDKNDVLREIASGRAGLVCSKLVNKKIIIENNIKFDEKLSIGEDQIFFLKVAEHTEKFKYVNKSLYYYDRTNEYSATLKYQENLYENFFRLQNQVKLIFLRNKLNSEEDNRLLNNKILNFTWVCINNEINNLSLTKAIKNIQNILNSVEKDIDYKLISKNKVNNLLVKLINNNNKISIIKIICFIKLLNIKVNLINKVKVKK